MALESRIRRISINTLFLLSGDLLSRLLTWAQIAYLTRVWSDVSTYGQYALAVNWIAIFVIFSELGLNALAVREVAHRKKLAGFYLRNVMVLRGSLSLFFWAALVGLSYGLGYEPVLKSALAVLGIRVVLDSVSGGYVYLFQAHEKMVAYAAVTLFSALVRFVGIVGVIQMGGGVVGACWVWVSASALSLLILVFLGNREGWTPELSNWKWDETRGVLKKSIPLALFGAFQILYYRVDEILLKNISGNSAVGFYDLATRVLLVVLALSQQGATAFFPVFSSLRDQKRVFGRLAARSIKWLGFLSVPITVGGILLARPLLAVISGPRYGEAGPLFSILCLSIVPFFLSSVFVSVLAVKNTARLNLQFLVLFILNVILNFILIPRDGAAGAAWATVLCEWFGVALVMGLAWPYLSTGFSLSLWRPIVGCLAASGFMGIGVWLDPRLYWLALGPVVYGGGLLLFGALDQEERAQFFSRIKRKEA